MKDIWCTFKARFRKLRKETVSKNSSKNEIIEDFFCYPLTTHFYPQPNKLRVKG